MCGIYGWYSSTGQLDIELTSAIRASDLLAHRGPDSHGQFDCEGVALLGARRLALVDIHGSSQPLWDESRKVSLVFNGEIYNYLDLRRCCAEYRFTTTGDGESILAMYRRFGVAGFRYLDGMFAFAIFDRERRSLILARDRFGAKPLYIARLDDKVAFASEIQALKALIGKHLDLDLHSVKNFIRYKAPLGRRSIFRGIQRVPPGHALRFTPNGTDEFCFAELPPLRDNPEDLEHEAALIEKNGRAIEYDGHATVLLSGGVDSSVSAALLADTCDEAMTVGYCYRDNDCDERGEAESVAKSLGLRHETVELRSSDVPSILIQTVKQLEEPLFAATSLSTYAAFNACRSQRVAYCGDGADELFLGYDNFPQAMDRVKQGIDWIEPYRYSIGWCPLWAEPFFDLDWAETPSFGEFLSELSSPERNSPLELIRIFEFTYRLPDYQMPRIDRLGMTFGIEARTPYLRNEVSDYFLSLPAQTILSQRGDKLSLRRLASRLLPRDFAARPKKKFSAPVQRWLSDNWAELVEQYVIENDLSVVGLDKKSTTMLVAKCCSMGSEGFNALWGVVVLGAWASINRF